MSLSDKLLYWLPRALSILFALFVALFALDAFSEHAGWEALTAFLLHLVPSFILLGAAAIAWRYDLVGAVMFGGFAVFYVWNVGLDRPWSWYAVIAAPAALVGLLFLLSWSGKRRRALRRPE